MRQKLAVIDIGSNSIRLMIAEAVNDRVRSLSKTLCTTRLAKGIDAAGCLAEDRMADAVQAIDHFRKQAEALGAPVLVYATSAVRDAKNRDAFLQRVHERTGFPVHVLSGEEEGQYAFNAVTGGEGTVFDIGGGSFQIVTNERSLSFPCGCVRAKDRCASSDPETLRNTLFAWMDERTSVPSSVPTPVYGVGGTISSIGALLAGQTEYDINTLAPITPDALDRLIERLSAIPESERVRHPILRERGEVILQGATILKYMMHRTGAQTVIPSDRDGMEGIAQAALKKHWNWN